MSDEGIEKFNRQDYAGAVECFITEMERALENGDYHTASTYANLIGLSLYFEHYPKEAIEYFQMAVDYSGEAGLNSDIIQRNLERTKKLIQDITDEIERKTEIMEELDEDSPERGVILSNLGVLHYLAGEREKAEKYYRMAELIFRKANDHLALAAIYNNIGQLYDDIRCLDYYYKALDILQREGHLKGQVDTYYALAQYYWKSGEWDEAYFFLSKAVGLIEELAKRDKRVYSTYSEVIRTAADIALRAGKPKEALELTEKIAGYHPDVDHEGQTPSF